MKFIDNRNFLIVRPKKKFIDWINKYNDELIPDDELINDSTIYMVDFTAVQTDEIILEIIEEYYREIFINELWSWHENKDFFPKNISFEMFNEWVSWEFIDMCYDMVDGPVSIYKES